MKQKFYSFIDFYRFSKTAREHERSIIFFDEFESLGAVRGKESTGPIGRVISELLSQM